ncbi:MAG: DUF6477 family protein [Thalassovita sp.]
MMDLLSFLTTLHRPRLLIRAARYGITEYRRDIHLTRILGTSRLPRSAAALAELINLEMDIDELRRQKAADYAPARHVELLIAVMGEAQLLRASTL